MQCKGITKKNKRCTKEGKPDFCHLHKKQNEEREKHCNMNEKNNNNETTQYCVVWIPSYVQTQKYQPIKSRLNQDVSDNSEHPLWITIELIQHNGNLKITVESKTIKFDFLLEYIANTSNGLVLYQCVYNDSYDLAKQILETDCTGKLIMQMFSSHKDKDTDFAFYPNLYIQNEKIDIRGTNNDALKYYLKEFEHYFRINVYHLEDDLEQFLNSKNIDKLLFKRTDLLIRESFLITNTLLSKYLDKTDNEIDMRLSNIKHLIEIIKTKRDNYKFSIDLNNYKQSLKLAFRGILVSILFGVGSLLFGIGSLFYSISSSQKNRMVEKENVEKIMQKQEEIINLFKQQQIFIENTAKDTVKNQISNDKK